jgi:periplasmic divalent cation tolerance protein
LEKSRGRAALREQGQNWFNFMNSNDFFVILSTCPDVGVAERLGRTLVEESLAACVNVVPGLRSIYRWDGAVQSDEEVLMIVKTTGGRLEAARERLVALHPYEVPEAVALPIADGHHAYLDWVAAATRTPQS